MQIRKPKFQTYGIRKDYKKTRKILLIAGFTVLALALILVSRELYTKNKLLTGFALKDKPIEKNSAFQSNTRNNNIIPLTDQQSSNLLSLSSSPILADLPKSAKILLNIGNQDFTVTKSSITPGTTKNQDITIFIPGKYLNTNQDFCKTLQQARSSGDLKIEIYESKTLLLIKYNSMLKYRDCLGI